MAVAGDWERLPALTPEFEATLANFRAIALPLNLQVPELNLLRNIDRLLKSAAQVCTERQQQIEPLIRAFNANARNAESK